jgi:outer membrane receptor protein involved in Fe transport
MRIQCVVLWTTVVGALASWTPRAALGQLALAAPTPRFYYAPSAAATLVEIDASRNAVLGRVVSLRVEHATIASVLAELQRQTGFTFAYDPHFPVTRPVTLEASSITVAAALGAILVGTGVDVVLTPTGHVWLRESEAHTPHVQDGALAGRITDKRTGNPIVSATVVLDPTQRSATADTEGKYRIANVPAGSYTVRVRYIGYDPLGSSITVHPDEEVQLDFALAKSVQQLEEVVTTGTVVPTEVKALPTPVSVITAADIEEMHPRRLDQVFRQVVPSAVAWDFTTNPQQTAMSVRGASNLSGGSGTLKVYLDGVEISDRTFAAIDPNSIERIEVIRGPQAAAIYGSDAIGGVMQVFTKRADASLVRPEVELKAAVGSLANPYGSFGRGSAVRQEYTAEVRGSKSAVSYSLGGGYTHTGDWIAEGGGSEPSAYAGIRLAQGPLTADLSSRYYVLNTHSLLDPRLAETGFPGVSQPDHRPTKTQEQTYGVRLSYTPRSWWQHNVVAGVDRISADGRQVQPRLTTPSDTLLTISERNFGKTSIAYNTSVRGSLGEKASASVTGGVDHYAYDKTTFSTNGALNNSGTITLAPSAPSAATRVTVTNTGYFGQVQINLHDMLFATGGVRIEQNSTFGDALGRQVSPRAGLSYAPRVGATTLKVRASYGESIHPPDPGQKEGGLFSTTNVQLANPLLGPERQTGWDAGFDLALGNRGSLSATYYRQIAQDLIQFVLLDAATVPQRSQFQNVGRVRNVGIELEGTLRFGSVRLASQYAYTNSRVQDLGPNYTGDLQVGDHPLNTPVHTAGASVSVGLSSGTNIAGGFTYLGEWTSYSFTALFSCFGGTGPCGATQRDYQIKYPGFVKVNISVAQRITPWMSGTVTIDNATNEDASEFGDTVPIVGRVVMVGVRARY